MIMTHVLLLFLLVNLITVANSKVKKNICSYSELVSSSREGRSLSRAGAVLAHRFLRHPDMDSSSCWPDMKK